MARERAEQVTSETTSEPAGDKPKRKVNRGARGPQPVYLFVKNVPETGKLAVTKSFRDPRKMAAYMQSMASDEQFLVTTPE